MNVLKGSAVYLLGAVILILVAMLGSFYKGTAAHLERYARAPDGMEIREFITVIEALEAGVITEDELFLKLEKFGNERRSDILAVIYLPQAQGSSRDRMVSTLIRSAQERPGFLPPGAFELAYRSTPVGEDFSDELLMLAASIPRQINAESDEALKRHFCVLSLSMHPLCS